MKRGLALSFVIGLLMVSVVSAGLFDVFKTGKASSDTQEVSVFVAGAPTIDSVLPVAGASYDPDDIFLLPTDINTITVVVTDTDGVGDLDDSSLIVRLDSPTLPISRIASCTPDAVPGNTRTYTCDVSLEFWDEPGYWPLYVYIEDFESNSATTTITDHLIYNLVESITTPVTPATIQWNSLSQGAPNVPADNDPTSIKNRGNSVGQILITGYNLLGVTTPAEIIPSTAFSVSSINGGECGGIALLASGNPTNTFISAKRGADDSTGSCDGSNEVCIYYCLDVPAGLSSQFYDTSGSNSWVVGF